MKLVVPLLLKWLFYRRDKANMIHIEKPRLFIIIGLHHTIVLEFQVILSSFSPFFLDLTVIFALPMPAGAHEPLAVSLFVILLGRRAAAVYENTRTITSAGNEQADRLIQ